jgi:hypothetical protein
MTRPLRTAVLALCALLLVASPAAAKHKHGKTLKLSRGATTLTLDKGAADALTSLGIAAAPLAPATAGDAGLSFPITTGRVDKKTLAGSIRHSGGLVLSRDATRVELRNFVIDTKRAVLTARVGKARLAILDLDLSKVKVTMNGKRLKVSGVSATLTKGAADALNGAFATEAFKPGLLIGTAVVKTRATPRR